VQQGIDVFMECTITRLIKDASASRVRSAIGASRALCHFQSEVHCHRYRRHRQSLENYFESWDTPRRGWALAYEAAPELLDMEFVQFIPPEWFGHRMSGNFGDRAVRGEGGTLKNNRGERFMEKYDPKRMEFPRVTSWHAPSTPKLKKAAAPYTAGPYLDISHKPPSKLKKKLPSMYHQFKELADGDITTGPRSRPRVTNMMGGIRVEAETGQSTVPDFSQLGSRGRLHGSNRLGGNSLSDCWSSESGAGNARRITRSPCKRSAG